jgi:hypothetical protein
MSVYIINTESRRLERAFIEAILILLAGLAAASSGVCLILQPTIESSQHDDILPNEGGMSSLHIESLSLNLRFA